MRTNPHVQVWRGRPAKLIARLGLVAALAGCGDSSDQASGDDRSAPTTAPTDARSPTASSTIPATTASSVTATAGLSLLGLGDSIPGGAHCSPPCRSYVDQLAELASESLARPVTSTNLATNDSLTSTVLLTRVLNNPTERDAITAADIITIQIGFNDFQGPCGWAGHEDCVAAGSDAVQTNLSKILDEITTLRGDKPTAIRVITYYDNTIGDPGTPGAWGFPAADDIAFHEFYTRALDDFDTMLCDVAASHRATCVDLRDAFNGPGHDQDAGNLVIDDHVHPTAAGQTLIATTIANDGFAPL